MSWNHNDLKKTCQKVIKTQAHVCIYCSSKDTLDTHDIKPYKYIDDDDSQSSSAMLLIVQYSLTPLWIYTVQPVHSE